MMYTTNVCKKLGRVVKCNSNQVFHLIARFRDTLRPLSRINESICKQAVRKAMYVNLIYAVV